MNVSLEAMAAAAGDVQSELVDVDSEDERDRTKCTVPDPAASRLVARRRAVRFLWRILCDNVRKNYNLLLIRCRNSPGENKITAFMQPTSLESGDNCRNLHKISWIVFISAVVIWSSGMRSRTGGLSNLSDKSHGTLHCAKLSKKSSFQDSCSKSCWSDFERVWNGTRQRTHRTAMNKRRAVVSYDEKRREEEKNHHYSVFSLHPSWQPQHMTNSYETRNFSVVSH